MYASWGDPVLVTDDGPLSTDKLSLEEVEAQLREAGFLDPTFGNKEIWCSEEPALSIFYLPDKLISVEPSPENGLAEPEDSTVINEFLKAGHEQFVRSCGETYTSFGMVQKTMEVLLLSNDTMAKQMMVLCMIALDEGLQESIKDRSSPAGINHLAILVKNVKLQMNRVLNTAFNDVKPPNRYSAEVLLPQFLSEIFMEYPG